VVGSGKYRRVDGCNQCSLVKQGQSFSPDINGVDNFQKIAPPYEIEFLIAARNPASSKAALSILPSDADMQNDAKQSIAVTAASASLMKNFDIVFPLETKPFKQHPTGAAYKVQFFLWASKRHYYCKLVFSTFNRLTSPFPSGGTRSVYV
jgi:hypothetical protein